MPIKYTKDQLITEFLRQSRDITKYVAVLNKSMEQLNDDNRLHRDALVSNTKAIQVMVAANDRFMKLFGVIMLVLLGAVVILAGAEKALKFSELFKLL